MNKLIWLICLIPMLLGAADPLVWPSQDYPYSADLQGDQAFAAALERMEAVNPFRYYVNYAKYDGVPWLTYARYLGTKNNLSGLFRYSALGPINTGLSGPGSPGLDSHYIDYPADPSDWSPYVTTNEYGVASMYIQPPCLYTASNWIEKVGVDMNWLSSTPRMALATAVNGHRNMHAISVLNYAYVHDYGTIPSISSHAPSTQIYSIFTDTPRSTNMAAAEGHAVVPGIDVDSLRNLSVISNSFIAQFAPPEWWLYWNEAGYVYGDTASFQGSRLLIQNWAYIEDASSTNQASPPTLTDYKVYGLNPMDNVPGVMIEPVGTNGFTRTFDEPIAFVGSWRRSTNGVDKILSHGWQTQIYPTPGECPSDFVYRQYKVRWQQIPTYCDGYYVVIGPSQQYGYLNPIVSTTGTVYIIGEALITGNSTTETTISINSFYPRWSTLKFLPYGDRWSTDTNNQQTSAFSTWSPMGIGEDTTFDGVDIINDYTAEETFTVTTPPTPWYAERWSMSEWYDELGGWLPLDTWYATFSRDLTLDRRFTIIQPKSLLFSGTPTGPLTLGTTEPRINWHALIQPAYSFTTNLVNLIDTGKSLTDQVEFCKLDYPRYIKPLPSENGPWPPHGVDRITKMEVAPIINVCYWDNNILRTNESVAYTNDSAKFTVVRSDDGSVYTCSTTTTYDVSSMSFDTSLLSPTNDTETAVALQAGGTWPDFDELSFVVLSLVTIDGITYRSEGVQYGAMLIADGMSIDLSWDAQPAPTTRYGVYVISWLSPFLYYDETSDTHINVDWADDNGGFIPPYSVYWTNITVYMTNTIVTVNSVTNHRFTLEAQTSFITNYYQESGYRICDLDTVLNVDPPAVVNYFDWDYWTSDQLVTNDIVSIIATNQTIMHYGPITWTNFDITVTNAGNQGQWRNSRWIPTDSFWEGTIQEATNYINAVPESPDLYRWYQPFIYSNDAYAGSISTGNAYAKPAQYRITVTYESDWSGTFKESIQSPILPIQIQDWSDAWAYPYNPLFLP